MKIIDAHMHLWDIQQNYLPWLCDAQPQPNFRYGDYASLRKNYLLSDYVEDVGELEVSGAVFVETEWDPKTPLGEVRWIKEIMRTSSLPSVVVAQARLDDEKVIDLLDAYAADSIVVGIRHKPKAVDHPDKVVFGASGSMGDPAWRRGFAQLAGRGLSYDLQTPWWHLEEAYALAQVFGDTRIILNHTGLPMDRSEEGIAGWHSAMRLLAQAPNVCVKISGLGVPGHPWTAEFNRRLVMETIELFGVERSMFASNYPVDSLVAPYQTIFSGFATITSDLSEIERAALFHGTAASVYRIPQPKD